MTKPEWMDKYPQVKALLQRDLDRLDYSPDAVFPPPPRASEEILDVQPPPALQAIAIDRILRRYDEAVIRECLMLDVVQDPRPPS